MTDERRPVESLIRAEATPDDAAVVVRGGPIAAEKIVEHALRQRALFTHQGQPMIAISVYVAVADWSLDRILRELMRSRSRYATAAVDRLRNAGFALLPTGRIPHYSLLLPSASHEAATALLVQFGPTLENPHRTRR